MGKKFPAPFRSLAVRNFRLFVAGQVVSAAGTWMMVTAQDWLVLSLTGDSGTALGTVTAFQLTPLLLFTLYGGRLADRYDKRRLLGVANAAAGLLALVLSVLVMSGAVRLWHVYAAALCLGLVNAVEVPARMAFVSELVGPDLLPNASSLSAAYFSTARMVGPAAAGLLIAWIGVGPVMLVNALSYPATVAALCLMRHGELVRSARSARAAKVVDGLRYVRGRPDLLVPLVLVGTVGLAGFNFQLTLPLLAKTVFHADASAFGLLSAAFAAGSLCGALLATTRSGRPAALLVTGSAVAFGALETVAGFAPDYATAAVLVGLTGAAGIYFVQAANHYVQLGSAPEYRGRTMALYTLVLQGLTPLGALLVGWLSARYGARSGLYLGGLVSLAAGLAVLAPALVRRRRAGTGAAPEPAPDQAAPAPSATGRTP
ncbi:MFS transporter [Streptomyces sp. NPDC047974]|uniref:MFS transporter n=1 Tax=Streptomyces sp. NPDC047974 TaxID=3154343 RepID=UPI0033FBB680